MRKTSNYVSVTIMVAELPLQGCPGNAKCKMKIAKCNCVRVNAELRRGNGFGANCHGRGRPTRRDSSKAAQQRRTPRRSAMFARRMAAHVVCETGDGG